MAQKIHQDVWPEGDVYLGPTVMVSNPIIQQLCHLAHVHAVKTSLDIENNIQSAQLPTVMKHVEDIMKIIHLIIPENAAAIPVSVPKPINPTQASIRKPLWQCGACLQWGHL